MKKKLFAAVIMLVSVGVAGVTPLLVESYQEDQIYIPEGKDAEFTVAEVSFSLDSVCYVQLAAGGYGRLTRVWFELDGDSLPPGALQGFYYCFESLNIIYTYLLDPGEHTISLQVANYKNIGDPTICKDAYLQALIFLPDTSSGAVTEQPMSDAEPKGNTPSLISKGPFVHAPGATELVDASGRVIENAISDEKVFISNLPTGTYFARNGDRTIVKIVKVD